MSKHPRSGRPDDPETPPAHAKDDDTIVVPKGSNRARFIMTALLVVLVLTTFTVSGEVVDVLTGRSQTGAAYVSWKRPDGEVRQLDGGQFMLAKQRFLKVRDLLSGGRSREGLDDAQVARHLLTDDLAIAAGVHVTDDEMRKMVQRVFGTKDMYKRRLASAKTSSKDFEETLRSILRVDRYETLLADGFAPPTPEKIQEQWKKTHREHTVDTIELPLERFQTEAEAACPIGAELEAWFNTLPEAQKSAYLGQVAAKSTAEFAWFLFEPKQTSSEMLLAKYPRPETENADDVARTWYETNKDLLYRKPDVPAGKPSAPEDYLPFEEVQARARTEGIAYQSILDWVNDMKFREQQEMKPAFYDEATGLRFGYRSEIETPRTRNEWAMVGMEWTGVGPADALADPNLLPGQVVPEVLVDRNGLFVSRLLGREEARKKSFPEIQEQVRAEWIRKHKNELGMAKLAELRAKFATVPDPADASKQLAVETDAAKFQAAAQELGLEVKTQDWFDPHSRVDPSQASSFQNYVRRIATRHGATLGAIPEPVIAPDQLSVWMARVAAGRDPDPARMTPLDYETEGMTAAFEAREEFRKNTFNSDAFLRERYALDLAIWHREDEEAPAGP